MNQMSRGIRKVATGSDKTITCKKCQAQVKMIMLDNRLCFKCDREQCKTCIEIANMKEATDEFKREDMVSKFVAKISHENHKNNQKRSELTFHSTPLEFCPECGVKIEKEAIADE